MATLNVKTTPTPTLSHSALAAALAPRIPSDVSISLYHIATSPARTTPLFTPAPSKKPKTTTLESHFVAVAHENVLAFAIELLVYTLVSTGDRIIFVSKADSSGYLPPTAASYTLSSSSCTRGSLVRAVTETAVQSLLAAARASNPHAKCTVSLFARAQSQYLFPNSAANARKHVLEDRGLITWWCRVLNPLVATVPAARGYLLVPGFDRLQTRKLLPPGKEGGEWVCGHPLRVDPARDVTVREIIPHFPDDPKARFVDELMADEKGGKARGKQWAGIRTVDDFWELMSMRQECSLGRCVGFIWVVVEGEPGSAGGAGEVGEEPVTPMEELRSPVSPSSSSAASSSASSAPGKKRSRADTLLLMSPRKKKLKALDGGSGAGQQKQPLVGSAIVLDEKRYTRTIDALLNHTDFGTLELAKIGTRKWVQSSYAVVRSSDVIIRDGWDWGEVITGTAAREEAEGEKAEAGKVNVLSVRRKAPEVNTLVPRKREKKTKEEPTVARLVPRKGGKAVEAPVVSTLMPRKKEKVTEGDPAVNTLAPRKKEKEKAVEEPAVNNLVPRKVEKKPEEPAVNTLVPRKKGEKSEGEAAT